MKRSLPPLWIGLIGLVWLFAIILFYFTTHKPLTPELAAALGRLAWTVFAAAVLISLSGGIGRKLARLDSLPPLARASVQAALGLGILAAGVLLLGTTVGLLPVVLWGAPLVVGILLWRAILDWWREWRELSELWWQAGRTGQTLAVLLAVTLGSALVVACAPPLKFDALMYHLALPQAYLAAERIDYLPWIVMSGHPQTTEMLYTWAMALGGAQAATVLSWSFSLLAVLGLVSYVRRRLDTVSAWVAAAALLAGYSLAVTPAWGYVDWLGLYFGLACLLALDGWRQEGQLSALRLAGLFAGLAFSTKYTAGVLALAAGGALVWHIWRRKAALFLALFNFAGFALLPALPWLVKNLLTTDNPLYPFFFVSGAMTPERIAVYQGMAPWGDWQDILLLPWRATYLGIDSAGGYSVSIGPLLLGLGALGWIGWARLNDARRAALENAAVLGGLGCLVWAVGNQFSGYLIQTRMYYAIFPAMAVLAGYGFWSLARLQIPNLRLGRIIAALVILVSALTMLETGVAAWKQGAPQAALGLTSAQDYQAANLGWFQPAMQAVRELPPGSKTLLLYEPRSFYCAPGCDPDEILDQWKVDLLAAKGDPAVILASWKQKGYTHLMVYQAGVDFLRTANDPHHPLAELAALDQFVQGLPAPSNFGGAYLLYTLP